MRAVSPEPSAANRSLADEELVARLVARDPRAMERVYDEWGQDTFAVAMGILGDRALAEDVVFEAHLALWRKPTLALTGHDSVQNYIHDAVFRSACQRRTASHVQAGPVSDVARGATPWASKASANFSAAIQSHRRRPATATPTDRASA